MNNPTMLYAMHVRGKFVCYITLTKSIAAWIELNNEQIQLRKLGATKMHHTKPLIKVWKREGFKLKLYDLNRRNSMGKWMLGYKFYDQGKLIFKGEDFGCSPCHGVDSLDSVYSLLGFLSLRSGDTDKEYFDDYTPEQMQWCQFGRAEELSLLVAIGEEKLAQRQR